VKSQPIVSSPQRGVPLAVRVKPAVVTVASGVAAFDVQLLHVVAVVPADVGEADPVHV
jgi:hypothetical protein